MDEEQITDLSGGNAREQEKAAGGYIVYEPTTDANEIKKKNEVVITTGQPAPGRARGDHATPAGAIPKVAPATKKRSPALPMAVATLALVMALGATALLLLPDSGGGAVDEDLAIVVPGDERPGANASAFDANQAVSPGTAASDPALHGMDAPLFAPKIPPGPRRLPHGSGTHTQAPPGGTLQNEAMNAVKRKDCPRALLAIQRGMREVSPDHAVLYRSAWVCFTDAHQRPLMAAQATTFDDFQLLLPHFEGAPELRRNPSSEELKKVPIWGRPALDGIEFRLEQWSADPEMHEVVAGLFGEPQLADTIAIDLHLIALAAEGLSRIPPALRDPRIEETWARRVYVVSSALGGLPGRMLGQHRRDILETVRSLQEAATTPRDPGDGTEPWPVPEMVLEAKEAGAGLRPVIPKPKPKPINIRDLEPELDIEEDPEINIERSGDPNFRGNE
jgi:hypothetical protein